MSDWLEEQTDETRPVLSCVLAEGFGQGVRLDVFLTSWLTDQGESRTRSFVQKLIADGCVFVNDQAGKGNYKGKAGDRVCVCLPEPASLEVQPENIPLDIVYEDRDLIVLNKERGRVVHPAPGNVSGTLVNGLLYHCGDLSDINGVRRPGIVHRIDKDTTGLLAVAKSNTAHLGLCEQLKTHQMARRYLALTEGGFEENSGTVRAPIGRHPADRIKMSVNLKQGKPAVTHFTVLERFSDCTLLECRLETGRTHQIRVHLAYIGHPVVGDPVYGKRDGRGMTGQALHAWQLCLRHPVSGREMTFEAPLPADFRHLLETLRGDGGSREERQKLNWEK